MSTAAQMEIEHLLDQHGAISRRDRPDLARALGWMVERGRLTAVLPGVYARADGAADYRVRISALLRLDSNAVLTKRAAAALTFWPELRVDRVDAALRGRRVESAGFSFERRRIPPDLLLDHHGALVTQPALTALDLVADLGGDAIDRVLRAGAATLPDLHRALDLTPHRRGNRARLEMLVDSRDLPWAKSERLLHRLLREAGLQGWVSNLPVRLAEGLFALDVAFDAVRVAIEVDGWEFHGRYPSDFDATLRRHSALVAAGWQVLHFSWVHLVNEPEWVIATIRATLQREDLPLMPERHRSSAAGQARG